jgi:uncharacterized membrane protein
MHHLQKIVNLKRLQSSRDRYMKVTKLRSVLKAISWRIIGTLDTMALGWLITGSPLMGLKIGGLELITKFVLYYFHERIWLQFKFGTKNN